MDDTKKQLNIEIDEDIAQGIYSNLAAISHMASEFVIDFIRVLPNLPKAKVKSRIILTPENAKALLLALKDNIAKYENNFGPIRMNNQGGLMPMNFGGPTPQA